MSVCEQYVSEHFLLLFFFTEMCCGENDTSACDICLAKHVQVLCLLKAAVKLLQK